MKYYVVDGNGDRIEGPFRDRRAAQDEAHAIRRRNLNNPRTASVIEVEQSDETTEEDDTTTMRYNFVQNGNDEESENNQQTLGTTYDWGYGDHSTASEEETSALSDAIESAMAGLDDDVDEEMMDVLDDARNLVASAELSDFECSHPDCGLSHGHGPRKHDITNDPDCSGISGFNVTQRFADEMEFVQNCHCGANEAAMLVQFFHYINIPMFQDQEEFEGVLEIEPDHLDVIYRRYTEENESVSRAVARAASRVGLPESEVAPLGVREDLKLFLERRQQMESQANKAPIGQHTRSVIEQNREEIEQAISQ